MKEIEAIKAALAAGPTPGPWKARCYEKACYYKGKQADGYVIEGATYESDYEHPMLCKADAKFIAAVNPAAMAAVLAHIDEKDAEIERLLVDAGRYRWLKKTTNWVSSKGKRIDVRNFPEAWDEAIDSAMKETP